MSKRLYKFHRDFGRNGAVEGLFVEEPEVVEKAIGKEVYFGEILGKHSEVYCCLDKDSFKVVSDDAKVVEIFETHVGDFGYNPLDYLDQL